MVQGEAKQSHLWKFLNDFSTNAIKGVKEWKKERIRG
jgi:hypothetical protein